MTPAEWETWLVVNGNRMALCNNCDEYLAVTNRQVDDLNNAWDAESSCPASGCMCRVPKRTSRWRPRAANDGVVCPECFLLLGFADETLEMAGAAL